MKKLILLILVFTACSKPQEQKQTPFPIGSGQEDEWFVFEGTIMTNNGLEVKAELSLKEASVGLESDFELGKTVETKQMAAGDISKGKYSISYGLLGNEKGITLSDDHIVQKQKIIIDKTLKPEEQARLQELEKYQLDLTTRKVYFRTMGTEKLIQTNNNFKPLTKDSKYILYRRSSLFTAEGYVAFDNSAVEFFERNTGENWKVALIGQIDSIKVKYIELATEKNEGLYLKALAYSIEDADSTNTTGKSIVIKRILRMEKSSLKNRID